MRAALAALALAPLAPFAPAAADLPPATPAAIAAAMEEQFADCRSAGGTPSLTEHYLRTGELNGDGRPDYLVDIAGLSCAGAWSYFCGSAGCPVVLWLSEGEAHRAAWSGYAQESAIAEAELVLYLHGQFCDPPRMGAEGCEARLTFAAAETPAGAETPAATPAPEPRPAPEPEPRPEPSGSAAPAPAPPASAPPAPAPPETAPPETEGETEADIEAAAQPEEAAPPAPEAAPGLPGPLPRPDGLAVTREALPEGWTLREVAGGEAVALAGGPGQVRSLTAFCLGGQPWLALDLEPAPETPLVRVDFGFADDRIEADALREEGAGGAFVVELAEGPLAGLLAGRDSAAALGIDGTQQGPLSLAGSSRAIRAALAGCHDF